MRILFVNYEYPPLGGGGGIVNAWLAEELAKQHDVTVLTSRAFDLPAQEMTGQVHVMRSRTYFRHHMATANVPSMATFMLSGAWAGRMLSRNCRFDIVNTHFALPTGPVGAFLSRSMGVPNVLSIHGGDLYDPSKRMSPHRHAVLRSCIRHIVSRADAVVGQSRNTNDNLRRYYDSSIEPLLIPLGIPKPPAATADRKSFALAPDEVVLITIGRLVDRKGTDQLVRLVSQLGNPKVRLIVLGDGPDLHRLKRQAADLNVADSVRFVGYVPDQEKVNLLAAADIYVSATQHEGFGLVYLEAMAQGLPVVCYDRGGQTDFLATDVNGAVVPLNDLGAFTVAVRELIADTSKRKLISERNRLEVERHYIQHCAGQYEALFRQLASQVHRCANPVATGSSRSLR